MSIRSIGFLLLCGLSFVLAACAGSDDSAPEQDEAQLPQAELNVPFWLAASETAEFAGEDLRVTFVGVPEDSRCAIGVRCVWAGQVSVSIRLEQEGSPISEATLTRRPGQSKPSRELLDDYEVLLTGVEPYPEEGKTIQSSDYSAQLIVRREN